MSQLGLASAYVDLRMKGDGAVKKALEDIKKRTDIMERAMQGNKLATYFKMAAEQQQKLAAAQGRLRWAEMVIQQGKLGAALTMTAEKFGKMKELAEKFQSSMSGMTNLASSVFAMGQKAIMDFGGAASPDAINTFTGSMRLLSMEIGRAFIPYLVRASYYIQQARQWVRGLSQEQKDNIARWVATGTAIAGAVLIIPKLVAAFSMLAAAAQSAFVAMAFLAANPFAAALLAIAAAALATAAAIGLIYYRTEQLKNSAKGANQKISDINQGEISKEQYESSDDYKYVFGTKDKKEQKRRAGELQEKYAGQSAAAGEENAAKSNFQRGKDALSGSQGDLQARREAAEIGRAMADKLSGHVATGKTKLGGQMTGAGAGGNTGMVQSMQAFQVGYSGIDQVRQQAQVKALEMDAMKSEELKATLDGNELTRQAVGHLGTIATNTSHGGMKK